MPIKNEGVKTIAENYNVSVSQFAVRYCLELGFGATMSD
jgi:hypothetical protein